MIEPINFEKIIGMKAKGFTDLEIIKKLACTLIDIRQAMQELAREMLNDTTRTEALTVELLRAQMLTKTFLPMALAGDAPAMLAYSKIAESFRIMLGLGAPRDAHPVLDQAAEPQRQTSVDRISAVIERLCASPAIDPDALVDDD